MQGIVFKAKSQDANNLLAKTDQQFFIENKGQWPNEVLYLSKQNGLNAWITKTGVMYDFYKIEYKENTQNEVPKIGNKKEAISNKGQVVKINLQNVNSNISMEGSEKSEAFYNYMKGNDQSKWASNVGLYKVATIKNIYNQIDERYYFDKGSIRYDYIVKPTGNVSDIQLNIEGANKTTINNVGDLVLETRFGEVKQAELYTYQIINGNKTRISSSFKKLENGLYGFEVGDYDKSKELVIDPVMIGYSTFFGGVDGESGFSMVLGSNNNVYFTGITYSENIIPIGFSGSYDNNLNVSPNSFINSDGFVASINTNIPGIPGLIAVTYIGGDEDEQMNSIDYDQATGNVYVAGTSNSSDYPLSGPTTNPATPLPFDNSNSALVAPYNDGVITIFNANLSNIRYSSYLGGIGNEVITEIKKDLTNPNAFIVTGSTNMGTSTLVNDYPTTNGSASTSEDVILTKISYNNLVSTLDFSLVFGSSNKSEIARSLDIDYAGNIYIIGEYYGNPATTPELNSPFTNYGTISPVRSQFVAKFNPSASNVLFAKRFGNTNLTTNNCDFDKFEKLVVDKNTQHIFITGMATPTFNCNAYNTCNGFVDCIVMNIDNVGNLIGTRYFGGSGAPFESGISIYLHNNKLFTTGYTFASDHPVTDCNLVNSGIMDAFINVLNAYDLATPIISSTCIGGANTNDYAFDITVGNDENIYIVGGTYIVGGGPTPITTGLYPVTPNAYDKTFNDILGHNNTNDADAFLTKLKFLSPDFCCSQSASYAFEVLKLDNPNVPYILANYPNWISNGTTKVISNKKIFINGTFHVDNNLTLFNCELYFTSNSKIVLDPNVTFTLTNGCRLQSATGCNMWDGIYADNSSMQIFINNSIIRDMLNGINISNNAKISSKSSTYFDNNYSIKIRNNTIANTCYIAKGNIFALGTGLKAPMATQGIPSTGIALYNCNNLSIGDATNYNDGNFFDKLWNGIYIEKKLGTINQTCTFNNNIFKNISTNSNTLGWTNQLAILSNPTNSVNTIGKGWAIFANNAVNSPIFGGNLTINVNGANTTNPGYIEFKNCDKGIYARRAKVNVSFNQFENVPLGVYLTIPNGQTFNVNNNIFNNTIIGICKAGTEGTGGFKVNNNEIKLSDNVNGIGINQMVNVLSPFVTLVPTGISSTYSGSTTSNMNINSQIYGNKIEIPMADVGVGISLYRGNNARVANNQIYLTTSTTANTSTTPQIPTLIGIYSNLSSNPLFYNNVINNKLPNTTNTLYVPGYNAGIYLRECVNSTVRCNTMDYLRYGLFVAGKNGSATSYSKTVGNAMNARTSMILWEFGSAGTMGKIGEDNNVTGFKYNANNTFTGPTNFNTRVYRNNTAATCIVAGYPEGIATTFAQLNPSQSVAAFSNSTCKYLVTNPSTFDNSYTCPGIISQFASTMTENMDYNMAVMIASDMIDYEPEFELGAKRIDEEALFEWLSENDTIRNTNTLLDTFYVQKLASTLAILDDIDRDIDALGDDELMNDVNLWYQKYDLALAKNASITSNNSFETNAKQINAIYLEMLNPSFEELDEDRKSIAEAMAATCHFIGGNAVFRAREIVSSYMPALHYDEIVICNSQGVYKGGTSKLQMQLNEMENALSENVIDNNKISVYPVPTNSTITVEYQLNEGETASFIIYDLLGNKLSSHTVNTLSKKIAIDLKGYANGIYTYQYIRKGFQNVAGKIIVND